MNWREHLKPHEAERIAKIEAARDYAAGLGLEYRRLYARAHKRAERSVHSHTEGAA